MARDIFLRFSGQGQALDLWAFVYIFTLTSSALDHSASALSLLTSVATKIATEKNN